jgi:hypothetical protein
MAGGYTGDHGLLKQVPLVILFFRRGFPGKFGLWPLI